MTCTEATCKSIALCLCVSWLALLSRGEVAFGGEGGAEAAGADIEGVDRAPLGDPFERIREGEEEHDAILLDDPQTGTAHEAAEIGQGVLAVMLLDQRLRVRVAGAADERAEAALEAAGQA